LIGNESGATMSTVNFDLHDRVFIITGAAQGIGAACARRLARSNLRVKPEVRPEEPGRR